MWNFPCLSCVKALFQPWLTPQMFLLLRRGTSRHLAEHRRSHSALYRSTTSSTSRRTSETFFFMLLFKRASLFAVKQRRKQREKQKLWCGKSNLLWKRPFSFHHFCSKKKKKKFSVVFIFVFNVKRDTAVNTPMCTWQKRPISLGKKAEGSFTIAVFNYKPPHGGKTGRKKNK